MVSTTKQQRKYGKKVDQELDNEDEIRYTKKFKVLIDGSNFLNASFETHEEAEFAAIAFCKNRTCSYLIVGGVNVANRTSGNSKNNNKKSN